MEPSLQIFTPTETSHLPPLVSDRPTVRQILQWYEADTSRPIHSVVAETERRRLWKICQMKLGDRFVHEAKPFDLLQLINSQPEVSSDWTRKRWNATIQRPFNQAEKLQLIPKNPFRGLTFHEGEEGRDWTDQEYGLILAYASPHFRRLVIGLRFSGLRPGEARGLVWSNIRPEQGAIVLDKHKTRHKTKKARCIPLNAVIVKFLAWLKRHNPPGTKHVFLNSFGRPWTLSMVCRTLDRIREKTGLAEDVKLHGARHTFATNALMNGVQLGALAEILGHARFATTQRYVHMTNKVDHLAESMTQAVTRKPKKVLPVVEVRKPDPPMPPFEGME